MLVLVWFVALAAAVAPLGIQGRFIFSNYRASCFLSIPGFVSNLIYTSFCLFAFIVMPFGIIIVSYAQVFRTMHKHTTNKSNHSAFSTTTGTGQVSLNEIRFTKTMFVLVLGFGACWIPIIIIEMLDSFLPGGALSRATYMSYMFLGCTSSALNPILYGIMNRSFRAALKQRFCCATNVVRTPRVEQHEMTCRARYDAAG